MLASILMSSHRQLSQRPVVSVLVAAVLGACLPLSLAPLNLWFLSLLVPPLLALLTWQQTLRQAFVRYLSFGIGFFLCGASWVFVSIHNYGNTSLVLAAFLTLLFAILLALIFAATQALAHHRWLHPTKNGHLLPHLMSFCSFWVLGEWFRSWFLTGFPWLYLGYGHTETALAGWAPLIGVLGVSGLVVISGCLILLALVVTANIQRVIALLCLAGIWLGGLAWQQHSWVTTSSDPIKVALVQPNIPQEKKWHPDFRQPTLERLTTLTKQADDAQWIIWPEAAIPITYHRATPFLEHVHNQATAQQQALISGILFDDMTSQAYYNSAVGLGLANGIYHKTRLVPFGEYVPLEKWLRGIIAFFNLPTSIISSGPDEQIGLTVGNTRLATAICYEVVYPLLVAKQTRNRGVILTISNDAWFGRSWGPLQHLQMAQMRAIETGRFVIRGTNNGISAIINPKGKILQQSEQFIATVVSGNIRTVTGTTPFMRLGHLPLLAFIALTLVGLGGFRLRTSLRARPN